jgi:copper(I)-binding protein
VIHRRAAVGAVCASAAMLTACGFQAPSVTTSERSEVQGASFSLGTMQVRAAFVAPVMTATTTTPYVVVTLVNDGNARDTLTGATSPLGAVTISGPGTTNGQLPLPARGAPVELVDPTLGTTGPTMSIAASVVPVPGTYVPITFTFANAGASTTEQVPVVPPGETTKPTITLPGGTATPPPISGDRTGE